MQPGTKRVQAAALVLACAGAVGCHRGTVHAASPPEATKPALSPQPEPAKPAGSDATVKPPASPESAKPSPDTSSPASSAPKPVEPKLRPASPPATPAEPAPAKPAPPQITLRMSPAEEAELKQQTQKSIAEAEANLTRASGHQLTDAQRDMVEKIRNFLSQSRDASELPDWSRARILAEKARLLSNELVNSL